MKKNTVKLLFLILLGSCSDEAPMKSTQRTLKTLQFKDSGEMIAYFSSVIDGKTDAAGRIASEQEDSFESFREIFDAAVERLSATTSNDEHDLVLAEYQDVLTLVDSTYVPKIVNPFYQVVCNRDGVYESAGYAHKVVNENAMVITDADNIDALEGVHATVGLDSTEFRVAYYAISETTSNNTGKITANCGDTFKKDFFKNERRCSDDRRVYVRGYASYILSGYQYTPRVISEAWGEQRNWLCYWRDYDTVVSSHNCSFTVSASINGAVYNYPMSFQDKTVTAGSLIIHDGHIGVPITWHGGTVPTIQFTRIHEEATSRGVGNNWVIMDCQ